MVLYLMGSDHYFTNPAGSHFQVDLMHGLDYNLRYFNI